MRNILLLAAFVMTASFATAQKSCSKSKASCAKTCAAKKAAAEASASVLSAEAIAELADLAAQNDKSIETRRCVNSGKVSYFQKSKCAKSGKISMNEVKYCPKSEAFINASPSEVMSAEGEAKVVNTAEETSGAKKSCSKGKKSCAKSCAGKKASAAATSTEATDVVMESEANAFNVLSASAIAELADLAAQNDESIQRKECQYSGKVSYFQKSECAKSGKISMSEVKFCPKSEAFINASPSEVMSAEGEAKVVKTAETVKSSSKKKACCKGKKACGSKKAGA